MPYLLVPGYEDADESSLYPIVVIDLDHIESLMDRIDKIAEFAKTWEVGNPKDEFKFNPLISVEFTDYAPNWYDLDVISELENAGYSLDDPLIVDELPEEIRKIHAGDDPHERYLRIDGSTVSYGGKDPWNVSTGSFIITLQTKSYPQEFAEGAVKYRVPGVCLQEEGDVFRQGEGR